jgi:uncharacterized protein (TIGR02757 family)
MIDMCTMSEREIALKSSLDDLLDIYGPGDLESDPVMFLHRYEDPADIEVVGFVAASLAFGRVSQIKRSISTILDIMGASPSKFVENFEPARDSRLFDGFVHRFTKGKDLAVLCHLLGQMVKGWGSIENFMFVGGPEDRDVEKLLGDFSRRALTLDVKGSYPGGAIPAGARVRYFFPSPSGGSACKRLNLFLRWMVRGPDGVDLGIWRNLLPSELVVPMDVHVGRISRLLGLTRYKGNSWRSALEVTESLKRLDAKDPTKYDYAVTRLGILGVCQGGRKDLNCDPCPLSEHCVCRPEAK